MVIQLIGNVDPQTAAVKQTLKELGESVIHTTNKRNVMNDALHGTPDLIIVAGWRHLVPPGLLKLPRLGVVGFHSAKLPEYPGRAPIFWTLLRGDEHVYNTMLFLDEGVDSGDVIDMEWRLIRCAEFLDSRGDVHPADTPETLYEWVALSCTRLLRRNLPLLKDGSAPRMPQDPARRGPVTTKDGYVRWHLSQS